MGQYENYLALGDVTVTISADVAASAIERLVNQPDAPLLIEMLGLDGAAISNPKCTKHGVTKVYATSGFYCKACKSGQSKAKRERNKERREESGN